MIHLDEAKAMIASLGKEKSWGTDPATKIYYAMIELGEAGDWWKHRVDWEYLKQFGITTQEQLEHAVAEELIDAIFYCLHALFALNPEISANEMFIWKFNKNIGRNRVYVDDSVEEKQ